MKTKYKSIFIFLIFIIVHAKIVEAQNIFDQAAQNNDPQYINYTEYKIATSNGFAYLLDDYPIQSVSKLVFMLNKKDNRVDEFVKKTFKKIGIDAVNLLDLKCTGCTTGEKMRLYMKEKGYECLLQITLDTDKRTTDFLTTSYFSLYGEIASSYSEFGTVNSVNAVLEWYNFEKDTIPFLKSWMYKESSHGLGNRMYTIIEGSIGAQIMRCAHKGLIKCKK